jgi:hypothetical protein
MRDMIRCLTGWALIKRGLLFGGLLLALIPAAAVERTLRLEAPATVVAGQTAEVLISASTDAGQGEQVGFLQAEMSVDDGRTWTAICYLQKSGPSITQPASLTPGPAGTTVKVRVRAAFRDGLAGDVDYTGAALRWHASWNDWKTPPAKHASIAVVAR